MIRHLVGMVIASPGVHTDLEANPKPNLDTEQGLSHTVTHEVDLEALRHLTDQEATLEAGAGTGIAEAEPAAGAVPMEVSIVTGVVDPMAQTVKVTEVTLITGVPARAADTAEMSLYRLCLKCKYLVT